MYHNINVLFVDGLQSRVEATATEFKNQGFDIKYNQTGTRNGILDMINNNRYDLVVSEYDTFGMPVTDVLNLLSEADCQTPLLVISDNDNENDMVNCIKAGCRGYLARKNISLLKPAVVGILCDAERQCQGREKQKQILVQNKFLTTTLESIGEGLIITDLSGRVTFVNKAALKLTGYHMEGESCLYLEEILRLSCYNDLNLTRTIFGQVINTGLPSGLKRDTVLTTYYGDTRYVSAMVSPVKGADGQINGVVIICRDISRLRNLEKELEEEQSKLSAILDTIPIGLAILDNNLIVRRVSPNLAKYTGKNAGDILNAKIGSSLGYCKILEVGGECGNGISCNSCGLRKIVLEVHNDGIAVHGREIQHSTLDGENKKDLWLRVNSVPITIKGERNVILVVDDVTASKRAEEILASSRNLYLNLFENSPVLIWRSGEDAKCNYFNKSWLEFTGHIMEEEMGDGWTKGVHPEDLHNCFHTYMDAFKVRQSFEMEYRLRRSDGEYRWINDAGRPFYDVEGNFLGYIGFCYDITEKKNEIDILSKYQLLSQKTNDIIIFINSEGNILEVNEAAVEAYGYTREEFKNLTLFDLRRSADLSIIKENYEAVKSHSIMFNTINYRKDGSSFPVEASWSRAEIGNEEVVLCVVRDISERRKFQERLERRNKEIKDALDRLKETQGQLVQQEKLAAIGHLAAGVAHEINNPLGFVMSNVETLEKYSSRLKEVIEAYGGLKAAVGQNEIEEARQVLEENVKLEKKYHVDLITEDLKALIDDTNDGLSRIRKIVMGLRTFARVDNQDEMVEYDLNEGVENTLMVANNEIKYHADVEKNLGGIPRLTLPGGQINQVLLNLIINAAHAIKERQDGQRGLIRISTYEDNGYVCCDIEDNGAGISNENLNKIFNPFFTTKPVGEGTGLGLSISYDIIVNKHGGEMLVNSTPGKGTTFTVKLPWDTGMGSLSQN